MKDLYNEYFYIPKEGKIREKVMIVRVAVTVIIMIACLAAMSFTAYAYFSHDVTSASNIIRSADFDVLVTVDPESQTENGSYKLTGGSSYTVNLEKDGTASTGFCIVEVTVGTETFKFHTQQIGTGGVEQSLSFTLDLTKLTQDDTVKVKFIAHWGTSRFYGYENENDFYITQNENVVLEVFNEEKSNTQNSEHTTNSENSQ